MASRTGNNRKIDRFQEEKHETREVLGTPEDPKNEIYAIEDDFHARDAQLLSFARNFEEVIDGEVVDVEEQMEIIWKYQDFTAALIKQNDQLKEALAKRDRKVTELETEANGLRNAFGTELKSRLQALVEDPGADNGGSGGDEGGGDDDSLVRGGRGGRGGRDGYDARKANSSRGKGQSDCTESPEEPLDPELLQALSDTIDAELMLAFL